MANELILIVGDNPKNLKLVRDILQVTGYQSRRVSHSPPRDHGSWEIRDGRDAAHARATNSVVRWLRGGSSDLTRPG